MRISDWSSDVCSSDLGASLPHDESGACIDTALLPPGPHDLECRVTFRCVPVSRRHGPDSEILVEKRRSEEHTSELQSLMRISYAVFCLKKKNKQKKSTQYRRITKTDRISTKVH